MITAEHFLADTRRTPISVITICNCGWQHEESRRQNARARTAKSRAAMNAHFAASLCDHDFRPIPREGPRMRCSKCGREEY